MTKTLDTLLEKAKINSVATLNGRIVEGDYGFTYVGELEEKWAIEFHNSVNIVELRHWGTTLIEFDHVERTVFKETLYSQSKTDKDGLNWFFENFNIDLHAHYYPSKQETQIHNNSDDSIFYII